MWKPILRNFDLEYPDGYLFWDKAGRVACDLMQALPGLRLRNQTLDQRDFNIPESTLELFYGIHVASLRSQEEDAKEFRRQVGVLVEILGEELELEKLTKFRFLLALGWACGTYEEALTRSMGLLPTEVTQNLNGGKFQGAELQVRHGPIMTTSRFTIVALSPSHPRYDPSGSRVPNVSASVNWQSEETLPIRDFKPEAMLEELENRFSDEMFKKMNNRIHAKPA